MSTVVLGGIGLYAHEYIHLYAHVHVVWSVCVLSLYLAHGIL